VRHQFYSSYGVSYDGSLKIHLYGPVLWHICATMFDPDLYIMMS